MKRHGKDGEEREEPQESRHDLGTARRPPVGKLQRVGQRHVPVDAHHRQTVDTRELIDAVQHHDHFARHVAEHPVVLEVLARYEGKTDHEESVSQGQVENVHRCGRRHLVQFQNGNDDERVAGQSKDANHQVENSHGDAKAINIVFQVQVLIHKGLIVVYLW